MVLDQITETGLRTNYVYGVRLAGRKISEMKWGKPRVRCDGKLETFVFDLASLLSVKMMLLSSSATGKPSVHKHTTTFMLEPKQVGI